MMMRPNKLEGLPLETLSSWILEFEGKARANPNLSDASFLGKLLVLPENVRLDWKVIVARYKHCSSFGLVFCNEEKSLIPLTPVVNVIKLFSFVTDDEA
jgi:hypothetical protein